MLWHLIEAKKLKENMTQNQVAELLKVSPAYVSRIKFGNIIPSYTVARGLADWLGITTGQVYDAVASVENRHN